ncbi:toxin TcdB middle/N-terminal domain-containing protein [Paraburkholderia dipogonis]|uniref:Toxin TcdB middle/N-terminal domain-containing protein n=1 Tax=Paraburkholderia dipogonis TaxID=1211383 RepID=A0ABW9B9D0_9BURK
MRQVDSSGNKVVYRWDTLAAESLSNISGMQFLTDIFDTSYSPKGSPNEAASLDLTKYAHHTHLVWSAPDEQSLETVQAPIWRSQTPLRLLGVDVATMPSFSKGRRGAVRRYHLNYSWNTAHTRRLLTSFQMEGRCTNGPDEDVQGLLPTFTQCARLPAMTLEYTTPPAKYKVSPWREGQGGNYPPFHATGPVVLKDVDGDAIPDFIVGGGGKIAVTPGDNNKKPGIETDIKSRGTTLATISDIAPGAPHTLYGDFLHDGRLNVMFVRYTTLLLLPAIFEVFSLGDDLSWYGRTLIPPAFSPSTDWKPELGSRLVGMDIDGDGLTDVFLPTGTLTHWQGYFSALDAGGSVHPFAERGNESCVPGRSFVIPIPGLTNPNLSRFVTDFDGDGVPDIVELLAFDPGPSAPGSIEVRVWKGRGDGRFGLGFVDGLDPCHALAGNPIHTFMPVGPSKAWMQAVSGNGKVAFMDLNADGLADIVVVTEAGIDILFHSISDAGVHHFGAVQQHIPVKELSPDCWSTSAGGTLSGTLTFDPKQIGIFAGDMDASGINDLVLATAFNDTCIVRITGVVENSADVRPRTRMGPDLLSKISNGYGATTELFYNSVANLSRIDATKGKAWRTKLPVPANVVTRIDSYGGRNRYTVRYSYRDPVYDPRHRLFLGFAETFEMRDPGDNTGKRTLFLTGTCLTGQAAVSCNPSVDDEYQVGRGLPGAIEVTAGNYFSEEQSKDLGTVHLLTTLYSYSLTKVYTGLDGRWVRRTWPTSTTVFPWDPEVDQHPTRQVATLMPPTGLEPNLPGSIALDLPDEKRPRVSLLETMEYDAFGNLARFVRWGDPSKDTRHIVSMTEWQLPTSDSTGWTWRPRSRTIGYSVNGGKVVPSRELTFDWNARGLLETTSARLSGTLQLRRKNGSRAVAPPPADASGDSAAVVLQTLSYDNFGNVQRVEAPNRRCADVSYDLDYNQLPASTIAYRSGCNSADPLVTTLDYDRGFEALIRQQGADTRVMAARYDSFGRLTELDQPDASSVGETSPIPAMLIDYSLADQAPFGRVRVRTLIGSASVPSYSERWLYLDGFGQPMATLTQGDKVGEWVVDGLIVRDNHGRITDIYDPQIFVGSAGSAFDTNVIASIAHHKKIEYDTLGRVLRTETPDGLITSYSYHPLDFTVKIKDPEQTGRLDGAHVGSFTSLTSDAFGRLSAISEHSGSYGPHDTVTTSVDYAATGESLSISQKHDAEPADHVSHTFTYDLLGRLVRSVEENSASRLFGRFPIWINSWRYAYNDNGELVGTSDARGCGENLIYDRLGRLVAEDYSPCTSQQAAYSSPDLVTGEGVERLNVYDVPAAPTNTVSDRLYRGRLSATLDLSQRSDIVLDARGRTSIVHRQLAIPNAGSRPFSSRYAPRVFEKAVREFDEANRAVTVTSGAQSPELNGPNFGSWVKTLYSPRGTVSGIESSYGTLIASQRFDAFGAITERLLGDAAHTKVAANYTNDRLLKFFTVSRSDPPWRPGVLTGLTIDYDMAGNPTLITDASPGAEWPVGAKPVALKEVYYDDYYRIRALDIEYAPGPQLDPQDDVFISPLDAERRRNDSTFPTITGAPNRVRREVFDYDWQGNTILADDDAHIVDRSPGVVINSARHPHQIASTLQRDASTVASYDAAGDMTQLDLTHSSPCLKPCPIRFQYSWDEVGQLVKAQRFDATGSSIGNPAVTITYGYNGGGVRVLKSVSQPGIEPSYSADIFDSLSLEGARFLNEGDYEQSARTERVFLGSTTGYFAQAQYVAPDLPTGTGGRTSVFFHLSDQLGSTAFVIDRETGELVERASYSAFGTAESDYRPDRWGNFRAAYRYTGQRDDIQVGLIYFGTRYYAPGLGRWISPDPLAVHTTSGNMNPYAFVRGSPMRLVDPIGLEDCDPRIQTCEDPRPPMTCEADPDCPGDGTGEGSRVSQGGSSTVPPTRVFRPQPLPPASPPSPVPTSIEALSVGPASLGWGDQLRAYALAAMGAPSVAFNHDLAVAENLLFEKLGVNFRLEVRGPSAEEDLARIEAEIAAENAAGGPRIALGIVFLPGRIGVGAETAEAGLSQRIGTRYGGHIAPGRFAGESVPAAGPTYARVAQKAPLGAEPCHSCGTLTYGTKTGLPIFDHQPANAFNQSGGPQFFFPQCSACSIAQGVEIRGILDEAVRAAAAAQKRR